MAVKERRDSVVVYMDRCDKCGFTTEDQRKKSVEYRMGLHKKVKHEKILKSVEEKVEK